MSGDLSADGKKLILRGRETVFYYDVLTQGGNFDVLAAVSETTPVELPAQTEDLGAAIAWSVDGNSYYTLGEGDNQPLYRYDIIQATGNSPEVG